MTRRTRLEDLVARLNTVEQARFYVEHLGADFSDYEAKVATYRQAVESAETQLRRFGRVQRLDPTLVPNFLFPPDCLVVVVGQDGLVANTLKYLDGQPVIGVNPDPKRWDGVLLPFEVKDLTTIVPEAQTDRRPTRAITMARARLSDGQELYAVNDLFIGYQWLGNGVAIGGATASTFTPTVTQLGQVVSVRVSYTGLQGFSESIASAATAPVAAAGGAGAVVSLQATLDFGNRRINTNTTRSVRVTNTGTAPLTITSVATSGGPFINPVLGTCATPVAVGRSCSLAVTFRPTAVQPYSGTLTVTSDATNNPTIVILSGSGR